MSEASEHSEVRKKYQHEVGSKGTKEMPKFGSSEYTQGEDSKSRRMDTMIIGGASLVAAGLIAGSNGAFEKIGEEVTDATKAAVQTVESTYETIKIPVDASVDLAGKLIPNDEPDKPRIPNKILLGEVKIQTSDKLNLRNSPNTTGKADSPNEVDWDDAKLANRTIVEGRVVYEPIEFKEGDTLIVKNPELVSGQYTGGGTGVGKERDWIQLYRTDGSPVYVNFQSETYGMVSEVKADPSVPSQYINADKIQDANGVRVVRYDGALPSQTSAVSVVNPSGQ